jgi:low affinity Fe/Cu permease
MALVRTGVFQIPAAKLPLPQDILRHPISPGLPSVSLLPPSPGGPGLRAWSSRLPVGRQHQAAIMNTTSWYTRVAKSTSRICGRPRTFALAVSVIIVWIVTGPIFSFSNTWQLVINTGTTIVTFLMVFLIQNTQNRDTEAIQIKLDELIRATQGAHNALLDLEELDEDSLEEFRRKYLALAASARKDLGQGSTDTGTPET